MTIFTTDATVRARYCQGAGIYRCMPAAVTHPSTLDELRAALAAARNGGLAIIPRGAGSAMPGNNVGSGMIIDLTGFRPGELQIDAPRARAAASPSMALAELNRAAASVGMRLPTDPSSAAWATLGGMVSTNAAGPRSVRDGSIRRWVHALTLETSDGTLALARTEQPDQTHPVIVRWRDAVEPLLRRHADEIRRRYPRTRKNSAGYALDRYLASGHLLDIVIGSEGTLGAISGVELELQPIPTARASLRVAVNARADLGAVIERIRAEDPATIELLDASFLRLVADQPLTPERPGLLRAAAGILLADFEGSDAADVGARASRAARSVAPLAMDTRVAVDADEIARLWAVRHGASPILAGLTDGRRSLQVIEDGCVPVARLGEYLDAVDAAAAAQHIDAVMFGHAGDGHVHVNLLPNLRDAGWEERVRAVYRAVSDAVIRLDGTPSGEHGTGRLRAGLMLQLYGEHVVACFRAIKQAFDPEGRWNPGVILGNGDPLAHLKVGTGAVVLPPAVEEYLLAIEAGARWAESRWSDTDHAFPA